MDLNGKGASGPTGDAAKPADDDLDSAIAKALQAGTDQASETPSSSVKTEPEQEQAEEHADTATDGNEAEAKAAAPEDGTKADPGQAKDDAPKHWPADRQEAFRKLPADGKDIVLKLTKDLQSGYTKRMQQVGDAVRFAEAVAGIIPNDVRAQIQQAGTNEIGFLQHLVSLHQHAARDPAAFVQWFVSQHPAAFQQQTPVGEKQQAKAKDDLADLLVDPEVKSLRQELAELKTWRDNQERQRQEWAREQQHQHVTSIQQAITHFRSAQDDQGQLMFPHFDQVSRAMGALMETHPSLAGKPDSFEKMQAAYEMAVRADPQLSKPLIDAEVTQRLDAERRKQEAARAQRASARRPSNGSAPAKPVVTSLDDAIAQASRQLGLN